MEYFIRKVQINGLFGGDKNYTIELSDGCNCIFGSNGTGKTTVINLIVNAINVDVDSLVKVPFDSLVIYIAKVGQTRAKKFITVLRVLSDEPIDYGSPCQTIKYLFSGDNERLSYTLSPRAMERRSTVDKNNFLVSSIKKTVQEKIKLTHIPLLRMHDAELYSYREDRDGFLHMALRDRDFSNSEISEILDPSVRVLTALQNKFIQQANYNRKIITEKLESLKSKIIEKVMIDDVLVRQTTKALGKISRTIESGMESIYTELYISKLRDAGILVSDEKLHEHFNVWKRLNESIKTDHKNYLDVYSDSSSTEKKKVDAMQKYNTTYFSLFVMTHFHERFLSIVRDAEVTQFEKSCLTKPFRDYEDEINLYFGNKKNSRLVKMDTYMSHLAEEK